MADEVKSTEVQPATQAKPSASDPKAKKAAAAKAAKAKTSGQKKKKPGVFKRIGTFLKELKSELRKVVWPSPKQVVNNTLAVVVTIVLSGVFVGVIDAIFKFLVSFLAI